MNPHFLMLVGDRLNQMGVPCEADTDLDAAVLQWVNRGGRMFVQHVNDGEIVISFRINAENQP